MEEIEQRSRGKYKFTWVNLANVENPVPLKDPTKDTELERGVDDNDDIDFTYRLDPDEFCAYLIQNFHHVFVKSNWNWIVDNVIRATNCKNRYSNYTISNSLLISGASAPPNIEAIQYYDNLFYETHWYAEKYELNRLHPRAFHAFGIDLDIINSLNSEETIRVKTEANLGDKSNLNLSTNQLVLTNEEISSNHFIVEIPSSSSIIETKENLPLEHDIDLSNYDNFEWDYVMFRSLSYYCADKRTELLATMPGKKLIFGRTKPKSRSLNLPPTLETETETNLAKLNQDEKENSNETKIAALVNEQLQNDNPAENENYYLNDIEKSVVEYLESHNVTVLPMLPYEDLMKRLKILKNQSKIKNIYVPDSNFDGGERSVLEGRALGINVVVEEDNPKLQELLTSPIYDHRYYADQLMLGLESIGLF